LHQKDNLDNYSIIFNKKGHYLIHITLNFINPIHNYIKGVLSITNY